MQQDMYVREKLRELQEEQLARLRLPQATYRRRPVAGPLVLTAGRTLRRMGERLESWASPAPSEEATGLTMERRAG